MTWIASFSAEGGPILVVDADAYPAWTGAALVRGLATKLHYWGQLVRELPAPYAQTGASSAGLEACETNQAAMAKLRELLRAVKETFPNATLMQSTTDGSLMVRLPDDRRMWADLSPKSAYDAAWQSNQAKQLFTHPVSPSLRGLFWDTEGAGAIDVGVNDAKDEVVLVRAWSAPDREPPDMRAVHELVASPSERERRGGEATNVLLPSGAAVFVWSPVAAAELVDVDGPGALRDLAAKSPPPRLRTVEMSAVGTTLALRRGLYEATTWTHEGDAWAFRACRLRFRSAL